MKKFATLIILCHMTAVQANAYESDTFQTRSGKRVEITFIKHGTLMMNVDGFIIHIDPVLMFGTDYTRMPKADLILVTHEHGDHFDKEAVKQISKNETLFISNGKVAELSGESEPMTVGQSRQIADGLITLTATAAYNTTPGRDKFHPKGRDVGYLIEVDGFRIYVSGDTEDIPELASLKDIDVAFLPVNQPYTMLPEQCVKAVEMFHPKVFYPYHYNETDLGPIVDHFKNNSQTKVRIRQLQ